MVLRLAGVLGVTYFVSRYIAPSPTLLACVLLGAILLIGCSRQRVGAEQFAPVYLSGAAAGLPYGVAAVQGRRAYMEDMHQIVNFEDRPEADAANLTHFFAVFDGHGGKRAAAWAHAHLVSNLLLELARARTEGAAGSGTDSSPLSVDACTGMLDGAAVDAFHRTDAAFLRQAAARGMPDGSTAVTCMVQALDARAGGKADRRLLVANLGDSRCVMVRADGSALALSSDHKPNRPDERARVQAAGGQVVYAGCWRVQGDLAVSRAFGDAHLKNFGVSATPELSAIRLTPRDAFLVLASDGLWDVVDEQQCAASVLRASDPLAAARSLCDLASTRGSMDNITVLVVSLTASG